MMTLFLASLAGHPAARGLVRQVRDVPVDHRRRAPAGRSRSAIIAAVNSVIAFFYYFAVGPRRCGSASRPRPTTARRCASRRRSPVAIALMGAVVVRRSASTRRSSPGSASAAFYAGPARRRDRARVHPARGSDHVRPLHGSRALRAEGGFFASGTAPGGPARDFVTSPEVGSLFGACVARALDECWHALERARSVPRRRGRRRQRPARGATCCAPRPSARARCTTCSSSGLGRAARRAARRGSPLEPADEALGPVRAAGRRRRRADPGDRRGPGVRRARRAPRARAHDGVVLANELLDNLPFGIAELRRPTAGPRSGSRLADAGGFVEVLVPRRAPTRRARRGRRRRRVSRCPAADPAWIDAWFAACGACCARRGRARIDYVGRRRPSWSTRAGAWLRTYRAHARGGDPARRAGRRRTSPPTSCVEQLCARRGVRLRRSCADTTPGRVAARPRHRRARRRGSSARGSAGAHRRRPRGARRPQPGRPRRRALDRSRRSRRPSCRRPASRSPGRTGALRCRRAGGVRHVRDARSAAARRPHVPAARGVRASTALVTDATVYDDAERDWQGFWAHAGARARLDAGVGHDPRVGAAVREVVRRRQAQRHRQLPRPPRRRPATATRSRSTGKASPATPAPSPTRAARRDVPGRQRAARRSASQKGDRVAIYMGMVPETVAAMLACARIGAPHSVVFGGFTAQSLQRPHQRRRGQGARHRRRRVAARLGRRR